MPEVPVIAPVSTDNLVSALVSDLSDDELVQFVLLLDLRVADLDFTKRLRDALTAEIEQEEANDD